MRHTTDWQSDQAMHKHTRAGNQNKIHNYPCNTHTHTNTNTHTHTHTGDTLEERSVERCSEDEQLLGKHSLHETLQHNHAGGRMGAAWRKFREVKRERAESNFELLDSDRPRHHS